MNAVLGNSSAITNRITASAAVTGSNGKEFFAVGERGREKLTEEAVLPSCHPMAYSPEVVTALTALCRFCCLPHSCKQCPGSA